MPGIAGIIGGADNDRRRRDLRAMVQAMTHEPFYVTGTHLDDDLGLAVGWAKPQGALHQDLPIKQPSTDRRLLFLAGECFPGDDLTARLGHVRTGREEDFLRSLDGCFAGLLVDKPERSLLLFNDRYSMHRLYFYEGRGEFLFASEAKALLQVRPHLREIDLDALARYFAIGCMHEGDSLFRGVKYLPGATAWRFKGQQVSRSRYFRCREWLDSARLSSTEYQQALSLALKSSVPKYFEGSRPMGLSMTGGLDTRMIVASLNGRQQGQLHFYTFAEAVGDTLDVSLARRVAGEVGERHDTLRLAPDFLEDFPRLANRVVSITDGAADVCSAHEIYLNQKARLISPVRMTGNYGSEILREMSTFKPLGLRRNIFDGGISSQIDVFERRLARQSRQSGLGFRVFQEIPGSLYGTWAAAQSQLSVRTPFLDQSIVAAAFRGPKGRTARSKAIAEVIASQAPTLARIATDRGYIEAAGRLKSLGSGLIGQLGFKLEYLFNEALPGWATPLGDLLRPLQVRVSGVHKYLHYRAWLSGPLSEFVVGTLLDPRSLQRPYLVSGEVRRLVKDHLRERRNGQPEINRLLSVELLQRSLIEKS